MRAIPIITTGVLGLLIMNPWGAPAWGQGCCAASGAGSVTGAAAQGVAGFGQFNVALFFEDYSLNETINENGAPVLVDGNRAGTGTVNLSLSYGWTARLTTTAIVGYFNRSRNFAVPGLGGADAGAVNADGIGDLTLFGKFAIVTFSPSRPYEVAAGAGIKLPLGNDNIARRGLTLPVDVQSGSGATDYLLWGRIFTHAGSLDMGANATWTITGRSDNEELGNYEFGNALAYEFSLSTPVIENFQVGLNLTGRWAQPDRSLSVEVTNTGGRRIYAGPTVAATPFGHALTFHGQLLLPIWEDVIGLQQGLSRGIRIGTEYRFGRL